MSKTICKQPSQPQSDNQIKQNIDNLIKKATQASKQFRNYTQEQVDEIVKRVTLDFLSNPMELAEMIQKEYNFGHLEDKYLKTCGFTKVTYNYLKDKKTVGIINKHDDGIIEFAEPVGVIAGILNCTVTGITEFFKIINALKTRNCIVFAPHPRTKQSSNHVCKLIYDYAIKAGAPEGCIQWIESPSVDGTKYLMSHSDIALIWATGGNAMVKAAYSYGKPALGVGPGNTPVYIDKDIETDFAAESILISKRWDGATGCTCESNLFVHKESKEKLLKSLEKYGYYLLNNNQKKQLLEYMYPISEEDGTRHLNGEIVGLETSLIIKNSNIDAPLDTQVLVCENENNEIGKEYPFSGEKLSNVLALYTVNSAKEGIELAKETLEYTGKGHTAVIYSNNNEVKLEFAEKIPACRIVGNSPATQAACTGSYNKRIPTVSLGCGKMGGNSLSQNTSYIDLLDIKRYSDRVTEDFCYTVPKEIYKDQQALEYLNSLKNKRIFVLTDPNIKKMTSEKLSSWLPKNNEIFISTDVQADPSFEIIEAGFKKIEQFKPDMIIAIGGGSTIDAAKGVWVKYEHPEICIKELCSGLFADNFPKMGSKASFIAIPTTCGTGTEVTPFSVISDTSEHRKYVLVSNEIIPNIALLIPELIEKLPKSIMVDTSLDALTHAIEAYVSIIDLDEADTNSINAVKAIFNNLPKAYLENDSDAKAQLLYASCEAGMAITNSYAGINHSLAHQLGSQFKVPHGKANAIFLEPVIKFNSSPVGKLFRITANPNNNISKVEARYAELAKKALGINANSDKQIVDEFCLRIKELMKIINAEEKVSQINTISETKYFANISLMAKNAFMDLNTAANPVQLSIKDLEELFKLVY